MEIRGLSLVSEEAGTTAPGRQWLVGLFRKKNSADHALVFQPSEDQPKILFIGDEGVARRSFAAIVAFRGPDRKTPERASLIEIILKQALGDRYGPKNAYWMDGKPNGLVTHFELACRLTPQAVREVIDEIFDGMDSGDMLGALYAKSREATPAA